MKVGLRTVILSDWSVEKIRELHSGDGITTSNILGHVDITLEEVHVFVLACQCFVYRRNRVAWATPNMKS